MSRILVIDDNPAVLNMTVNMLIGLGHKALPMGSGMEGLEALDHAAFDLVITDLHMPQMTGAELILHLKAQFPQQTIIAMSGSLGNLDTALTYAGRLGADVLLPKPFTTAQMLAALQQALARGV